MSVVVAVVEAFLVAVVEFLLEAIFVSPVYARSGAAGIAIRRRGGDPFQSLAGELVAVSGVRDRSTLILTTFTAGEAEKAK